MDIRGLYPKEVTPEVAESVAAVAPKLFADKKGTIIVAHDGRHGGPELAQAVIKTLENVAGKPYEIIFVGLSTTPMFYFLVNHLNAIGGFMITASHNPKTYNGMKVVGKKAIAISGKQMLSQIENK